MRKTPEGKKFDQGKLRYDLVPSEAEAELVKVLTVGAERYGDRNWEKGIEYGRLYAAARRHMEIWRQGETIDEIGTHHLANACINLLMLLQFELRGTTELDDLRATTRVS